MKFKLKLRSMFLALSVLSAAYTVHADDTQTQSATGASSPSQTSTVKVADTAAKAPSKFEMTYFGIYLGPSLAYPGQSAQVNPFATGQNPNAGQLDAASWPQVLENQIKLNYKITDNVFVGPVANFYFFPGQTSNSIMQDSGIRVGSKSLYRNGGFNLSGDLRALAPVTPGDSKIDAAFTYEALAFAKYDFPHSKWTVGLLTFDKYHTYNNYGLTHLDADFYVAPTANWQFSQKFAATLYAEFYPTHTIGEEGWNISQPFDLNPGINWDITDNFSLNPGVVLFPGNLSVATSSVIVYISNKFF